jgi:hypothetical protein
MAQNILATAGIAVNLLSADSFKTEKNKKFLQSTIDQMVRPGLVRKINGFIGRKNAKATRNSDIYISAPEKLRERYQLEPAISITDDYNNVTFYKDYIDYINQIKVFGGNIKNHSRLNQQEFYSWDPHINWDKFVNFQNYYWLPNGPSAININSYTLDTVVEYTVSFESINNSNQFVFSNTLERNPVLTLHRERTYKFTIDCPNNPFSIFVERSIDPNKHYTSGISEQGIEQGTLFVTLPKNSPNVLYYSSQTNIDASSVIQVLDYDDNVFNVENEILGKTSYTVSDKLSLSNGMKLSFGKNTVPEKYSNKTFYVEGVGSAISLIRETDLFITAPFTSNDEGLFDNAGFDSVPFGGSSSIASVADYIVSSRNSNDRNPWSRYNRWFHKDVIESSASYNNLVADIDQTARASRPIIEFDANLKLFNFGTHALPDVHLFDTVTADAFSNVQGSFGYYVDGELITHGQRVIFTSDTDANVRNNIYRVEYIDIQHISDSTGIKKQVRLVLENEPVELDTIIVTSGKKYSGLSYWFNGNSWISAQQKTSINQHILFDVVDDNNVSFSNNAVYPGTTFTGTKIFSYKTGNSITDTVLGFPLAYKNIGNIGDIVFKFDLASDTFTYEKNKLIVEEPISQGFLPKYNSSIEYNNGWQKCTAPNTQAAIRIYKNSTQVNNFEIDIFNDLTALSDLLVRVYVNSVRLSNTKWKLNTNPISHIKTIVLNSDLSADDVLSIRAFAKQPINENGYYEIPLNLQNNPLNEQLSEFTLGEVIEHVNSIVDNLDNSFAGMFPGSGNLRDLGNVTQYGTKFVQHSGPMSIALYHLTSESHNVIKALDAARVSYTRFKREFVTLAETIELPSSDPVVNVSKILSHLSSAALTAKYNSSDMAPFGANTKIDIVVLDSRITLYPLARAFSLSTLSNQAVNVYLNNVHLLHNKDYTFVEGGYVSVHTALSENDILTIYEYENTNSSYIPATPTKLGMWPKFEPKIYLDTTLATPLNVIQGHDGSIVVAYNDHRDDLILELEKRIYNNIKVQYNASIFDILDFIPGYNRDVAYSFDEFNQILAPFFYKWLPLLGRDFTKPLSYSVTDSFTYNYRNHVFAETGVYVGYWRGIYKYAFDTDRPHLCPWEMLGFFEEPQWWITTYGPAPYTSDNLIMWNDISSGTIRDPNNTYINKKVAKPHLLKMLPVNAQGKLLSPNDINIVTGFTEFYPVDDFVFGDGSPIESVWKRSSHFPFSLISAALLMQPNKTFSTLFDKANISRNKSNQLVYNKSKRRIKLADIDLTNSSAGLINYIVDHITDNTLISYNAYKFNLSRLTVLLGHRVGAFTTHEKFNLVLDSKSLMQSSSVFVPKDDYRVVLNTSSPSTKIYYSGIIITKTNRKYILSGYNTSKPYFSVYEPIHSGYSVTVGGVSEYFIDWVSSQTIAKDKIVSYNGRYFKATSTHTSTETFDASLYTPLSSLPVIGGLTVLFNNKWNKDNIKSISYGTEFNSIQDIIDVILGYAEVLKDDGFIFDDFNPVLQRLNNWDTAARDFLLWSLQNWSSGADKSVAWDINLFIQVGTVIVYNGEYFRALKNIQAGTIFNYDDYEALASLDILGNAAIILSPAKQLKFSTTLSSVKDISSPFLEYEMLDHNGNTIPNDFMNSYNDNNIVSYSPTNSDIVIYGASFTLVQSEHIVLLNNSTMFNNTIYNPASGYKQDRIKVSGYISTYWDGSVNAPGFLLDNANIKEWAQYKDYILGDTVKYKDYFYSANSFIAGTDTFDLANWVRQLETPKSKMMPNWTYKASQLESFYDLDSDNFDIEQQKLAQHLVGYQKRQYLENIIQDDISEYKFYNGMITEKGTSNVLSKLFKLKQNKAEIFEEWAVRSGQYGANSAYDTIEFILDEPKFINNPQPVILDNTVQIPAKFAIIQQPSEVYLKPLSYNTKPWPQLSNPRQHLRSAGYVRRDDVTLVVAHLDKLFDVAVTELKHGEYVWCTFDDAEWNVYRYTALNCAVIAIDQDMITIDRLIDLSNVTHIGVEHTNGTGKFCKINSVVETVITTNATFTYTDVDKIKLYSFESRRFDTIDSVKLSDMNFVKTERFWTDDYQGSWASWKYSPTYTPHTISANSIAHQTRFGRAIAANKPNTILAVSSAARIITVYDRIQVNNNWVQRQTIELPFICNVEPTTGLPVNTGDKIASVMAMSPQGNWLVTGSPLVSKAATHFKGIYNSASVYHINDVVSYTGKLYTALESTSTVPTVITAWKEKLTNDVLKSGTSSTINNHGIISIYKRDVNNNFSLVKSITSPLPTTNEQFGSTIHVNETSMLVSAFENNATVIHKLSYTDNVEATTYYNPFGSQLNELAVMSTANILEGMKVIGSGFNNHIVKEVKSPTLLILDRAPDSVVSGQLQFVSTDWKYDSKLSLPKIFNTFAVDESFGNLVIANKSETTASLYTFNSQTAAYEFADTISDTSSKITGDIELSPSNQLLAISKKLGPEFDNNNVIELYQYTNSTYTLLQTLSNPFYEPSDSYGSQLYFSNNENTLVVYSKFADAISTVSFNDKTTFDSGITMFVAVGVNYGRIDIFNKYHNTWLYSESIKCPLVLNGFAKEFGKSIVVADNSIIVGAPGTMSNSTELGSVYDFVKLSNTYAWTISNTSISQPDVSKIKQAFLYNKVSNNLITYLDLIDPINGRFPGIVEQELSYKCLHDPAIYSIGTNSVVVDEGMEWFENHVGELWWDLSTAKFVNSYINDTLYQSINHGLLAEGASIDIYEWVSSDLLPSEWNAIADTNEGMAQGISGTTLYDDAVYSVSKEYDTASNRFYYTYYYWVKNKKLKPDISSRQLTAFAISQLISNPRGQGYRYMSLTNLNSFQLVNVNNLLKKDEVVLSVEYWTSDTPNKNIHGEWKLISNHKLTQIPSAIEQKWIDSLCGKDLHSRTVPDMNLPIKLRYGIENRPRQSMFINRFAALRQIVETANAILKQHTIVSSRNLSKLLEYNDAPEFSSNQYDLALDTDFELQYTTVKLFVQAKLQPVITDGRITSVIIVNAGNGYATAPTTTISGTGTGAKIVTKINDLGQIIECTVLSTGYGYLDGTTIAVRSFCILVKMDSTANNNWSIYSQSNNKWVRSATQTYDTRNYWEYIDWFDAGYNEFSFIAHSVVDYNELVSLTANIGDLVKIRLGNINSWTLVEKIQNKESAVWSDNFKVVGIENGTIRLKSTLYEFTNTVVGYDGARYDSVSYDFGPDKELRLILTALKDDLLIDELRTEFLNVFFTSVRYLMTEHMFVDWIFKTSFVKMIHHSGSLAQSSNFVADTLTDYETFVAEVKPYRTQVREYINVKSASDTIQSTISDFDLPLYYDSFSKHVMLNETSVTDKMIKSVSPLAKSLVQNSGNPIKEFVVVNGGSGYTSPPLVKISFPYDSVTNSSSTSTATAIAFVANGTVSHVALLTNELYTYLPTIELIGGLSVGGTPAKVVAVLDKGNVRSTSLGIKFDRINSASTTEALAAHDSFVASGKMQYILTWAPDTTIGKTRVTINNVEIPADMYIVKPFKRYENSSSVLRGVIIFDNSPLVNSAIDVYYTKNVALLSAIDRIKFHYSSELTKEGIGMSQLMSGIDYGGVIVNGLGFNQNIGWGSQPYYTDVWDSFDAASSDHIHVVMNNEHVFELPYIPEKDVEFHIYHIRTAIRSFVSNGINTAFALVDSAKIPVKATARIKTVITGIAEANANSITVSDATGIKIGSYISIDTKSIVSQMVQLGITLDINFMFAADILVGDISWDGDIIIVVEQTTIIWDNTNQTTAIPTNTIVTDIVYNSGSSIIKLSNTLSAAVPANRVISTEYELVLPNDENTISDFVSVKSALVVLKHPLPINSSLIIEFEQTPVRIDDTHFNTPHQTNDLAVMNSIISSGSSATIEIPASFNLLTGDKFIVRRSTSDGSLTTRFNYDTVISGGTYANTSAQGILPEEIIIDGSSFINPVSSYAPEEVVPGQVVDALAIKVYEGKQNTSAKILIDTYIADGNTDSFLISQLPNSIDAVFVNVTDNNNTIYVPDTEYTVDYKSKQVVFNTTPLNKAIITIRSFSSNGYNILDTGRIVCDGISSEFNTSAVWFTTNSAIVYINGHEVNFTLSSMSLSTVITLDYTPAESDVLDYIIFDKELVTTSIVSSQTILANGTNTYDLLHVVGNAQPLSSNMIVKVSDRILQSATDIRYEIKSNRYSYEISKQIVAPNASDGSNIAVSANGVLLVNSVDYVYNRITCTIKIARATYARYKNTSLVISVAAANSYSYVSTIPPQIVFANNYSAPTVIEIISFYNHDILQIQRSNLSASLNYSVNISALDRKIYDNLTAGFLQLNRGVIDDSYVWVIKNGILLAPSIDYKLTDTKDSVLLSKLPISTDKFSTILFGQIDIVNKTAYMQFKDMLNRTHYKRLSNDKHTRLAVDLHATNDTITVVNSANFDIPDTKRNIPGIIEINKERIEYFTLEGNVLGQLRRGTLGTGVPLVHIAGTAVQSIGKSETIPYNDTLLTTEYISAGISDIVHLDFIPNKSKSWITSSYQSQYGQCDEIEVFVGNVRLKKEPYIIANMSLNQTSPEVDVVVDAEFAVSGVDNELKLSHVPPTGVVISVVRKTGLDFNIHRAALEFINASTGVEMY